MRPGTRPIISNEDSHADLHNRNTGLASEIISTGGSDDASSETDAELVEGLPEPEIRDCDVPVSMHGWRIDRALAALVPEET